MKHTNEKENWASRAKANLDSTLDFIQVYAPQILKAGAQISLLGFAGAMMVAQFVPDASLMSQIAGGAASSFLQMKETYISLFNQASDLNTGNSLTANEQAEQLRAELDQARELVEELSETITTQQTTIEAMSRAMVMINTSHNTLMNSHTQMRDALSQAHHEINAQALKRGDITYVPFDADDDNFVRIEESNELDQTEIETGPSL